MPDQKITRYVDLGRLLAMLGDWPGSPKGRMFFAFPDRLGDPQEGVLGDADHQTAVGVARTRYNGTPARAFGCWLSREWQDKLLTVGLSCWYIGDTESHAMWQIFGVGSVAIESTVEKIKHALSPAGTVQAKIVQYVDYPTRPGTGLDPVQVLSFKRSPYQHEKELRFVVTIPDEDVNRIKNLRGLGRSGEVLIHEGPHGHLGPNGITVPLDVVRAIDRVVLAPSAPTWLKNAIFHLCITNGIEKERVDQSKLDDDPYPELSSVNRTRLDCDRLAMT
jgi:hypothetical protein